MAYSSRKERTDAKRAAAAEQKVSVRTINRLKICDKPLLSVKNRDERAKNSQEHRELCEKVAKVVLSGEITPKQGALHCDVSLRQMYRYVSEEKARHLPAPSKGTVICVGDPDGTLARPWVRAGYDAIVVDPSLPRGVHTVERVTKVGATLLAAMSMLARYIANHSVVFIAARVYDEGDGADHSAMTNQCQELAKLSRSNYTVLTQNCKIVSCSNRQLVDSNDHVIIAIANESFVGAAQSLFCVYNKDSTTC